jgi:hypothetical protein
MNPWASLLRSRKFWVMMLDLVVSLVLYFTARYANPAIAEDIKFLIASLQPVFLFVIASIAYEDKANVENGYDAVTRSYTPPCDDLTAG